MGFKTFTVGEVLTAGDVNNYLMKQAVIVCTSGTRPSTPPEGMVIYETDTDLIRAYNGTAWVTVAYQVQTTTGNRQADEYTTTTATFGVTTSGGIYADCGVAFVAPASGRVTLQYTGQMSNSGASGGVWIAPVVRTGSTVGAGTSVLAADDSNAIKNVGVGGIRYGASHLLESLTAGSSYNVRLEHRIDTGTGTIRWRGVIVSPGT